MSVVDYYRASHQDTIKLRLSFLTSLRLYQAMMGEVGGGSRGGGGSSNSCTEMIGALQLLPPAMTHCC